MGRWHVGFVASIAIWTLLLGCGGPPPSQSARGEAAASSGGAPTAPKRIRVSIQGEPFTLSRTAQGNVGRVRGVNELELLIHAGLAVEEERGVLQPRLAEAVPSLENGLWRVFPDGRMETTWRIKPGVQWHDGTPLTPADLLFTVRVGQDPEMTYFHHVGFDAVESAIQSGPDTITVRWNQPYFDADSMFTSGASFAMPLPRHILEAAYENNRAGFLDQPYWLGEFVGLGPFKLREYVLGSHLMLDAFPQYV